MKIVVHAPAPPSGRIGKRANVGTFQKPAQDLHQIFLVGILENEHTILPQHRMDLCKKSRDILHMVQHTDADKGLTAVRVCAQVVQVGGLALDLCKPHPPDALSGLLQQIFRVVGEQHPAEPRRVFPDKTAVAPANLQTGAPKIGRKTPQRHALHGIFIAPVVVLPLPECGVVHVTVVTYPVTPSFASPCIVHNALLAVTVAPP